MKISVMLFWLSFVTLFVSCNSESEKTLNLSNATILLSPNIKSPVRESAGEILIEEIANRTSLQLKSA